MKYPRFISKNKAAMTVVLGMLLTLGAAVTSHAASISNKSGNSTFEKYDTNQDGFVSKEEAEARKMSIKAFEEADANHDGKLNNDEFAKAESINERVKVAKYVDDSVVTAKVKAELLKHSLLKGLQVHVETYKGEVQLSGFVDNDKQIAAAGRIAAGVEGVTKVINNLIPKN